MNGERIIYVYADFYLELLKEQRNNYNEKDIRKSNDGKYNTWTDEVCDNK